MKLHAHQQFQHPEQDGKRLFSSCRNITLSSSFLSAQCETLKGKENNSKLDLNNCIISKDGKLEWGSSGGYLKTNPKCILENNMLNCTEAKIDLDERIRNIDGSLICHTHLVPEIKAVENPDKTGSPAPERTQHQPLQNPPIDMAFNNTQKKIFSKYYIIKQYENSLSIRLKNVGLKSVPVQILPNNGPYRAKFDTEKFELFDRFNQRIFDVITTNPENRKKPWKMYIPFGGDVFVYNKEHCIKLVSRLENPKVEKQRRELLLSPPSPVQTGLGHQVSNQQHGSK